jgi:hypothetical protein
VTMVIFFPGPQHPQPAACGPSVSAEWPHQRCLAWVRHGLENNFCLRAAWRSKGRIKFDVILAMTTYGSLDTFNNKSLFYSLSQKRIPAA